MAVVNMASSSNDQEETFAAEAATMESYSKDGFMKQIDDLLSGDETVDTNGASCEKLSDEGDETPTDDVLPEDDSTNNDSTDEIGADPTQEESDKTADPKVVFPKERTPTKVKFSGMEGPSPPPSVNLENASRSELIAKLGGLQERLTQAQVDLREEKSNRRKKEKSLVKLAKELSKRQSESLQKEQDIVKVSTLCS